MRTTRLMLVVLALAAGTASDAAPRGSGGADAARIERAMAAARTHVARHEKEIVRELRNLLALPNVAASHADIRRNADLLIKMLKRRGVAARVLETRGAPVSVYGELKRPGAKATLLFYAHFDGQPVEPLSAWATPPFQPTLRRGKLEDKAAIVRWEKARHPLPDEARIYARSASDDKAPIVAMLAALDAMAAARIAPSVNLKFFLEGEEEAGSPNLARTLAANRTLLKSDIWIFGDGPIDPRGLPRVALGARGVVSFQLTVFGPATSLHSGHYGNVAPNPAARLAHLIASMRADDGRILIDGMSADAPSSAALALARDAFDTEGMLKGPQIKETESGSSYGVAILRPALNVTQLIYGGGGPQRNAIDPQASAGFDIRLTPGLSLKTVRATVEAHVREQGYVLVDREPTAEQRRTHARLARIAWEEDGYGAAMADLDHPQVERVIAVMRAATKNEVRVAPLMGGSLPIAPIGDVLGAPFAIVPIVNADNNQHAPNENIRLREFRRGIELYAALLAGMGE